MKKDIENQVITRESAFPVTTPEARENEMIALAMDVVEQRMRDGTASAMEVCHFLKLGSTESRLARKETEKRIELADAKIAAYKSAEEIKELYAEAITSMKEYGGSM